MNTDVISFKFYFFFNNVKNFHFLLGTHSSDDALVKERKRSTIVKHYHSLLKIN